MLVLEQLKMSENFARTCAFLTFNTCKCFFSHSIKLDWRLASPKNLEKIFFHSGELTNL